MKVMSWNSVRRGIFSLAVLAVASFGAFATAQETGLAKRIDLFLQDADLLRATQMLTRETGVQFAIAPSDKEFDKINLSLKGVTAEDAIRYICEAAGAYAERDENGVFIIKRGPKPSSNQGVGGTTVQKPRKIERIKITKADPKYVYDMLTKGVVFDPDYGFREMNRFSQEFQTASIKPGAQVVMVGGAMVNPGYSYPVSGNSGAPLPEDTSAPLNDGGGNGVFLPGETANQFGGGGRQGGGGGGQGGGGQGGGQGGQGQGGGALQSGTGFTPDGITRVTYDPTTNSLIVEGDDEAIRKLRTIVNLFDVAPKQVIIKVEFVTTSQSVSKALGMDWLYQRGAISTGNRPGTFARTGDPIFINYATGNITTRLRTQLTDSGGKTVNAPLIRTLNNQTATVFQNNQTTVFINQTTVSNGTIVQTSNPQQLTIQTGLTVRPRINDDGYVTMTLSPTISDFGQFRRSADGQEIPDVLTQSIAVVARVKSGDTIALGGLTRKQTNTSTSRFPILSDLPLIGSLFRSSNTERSDSELIIFVTPIIVEDDTVGGFTP